VVLIVLNGEEGIREQDKRIAGLAHEAGRAIIIVVNKWDAVEKDTKTMREFELKIRDQFRFLDYAPIAFVSAKTKSRVHTLFPLIHVADEAHKRRVQSSTLNEVLVDSVAMNPTPTDKTGKRLNIFYGTQVSVSPPTFVVFVNDPELMHFSYKRYLENRLREAFDFTDTPIHIITRKRNKCRRDIMNISKIGTGSFGTSMAMVLDSNHHNVLMYGRNEQTINEINNNHSNKKYLKDIELNESIRATNDLKEAVTHGD